MTEVAWIELMMENIGDDREKAEAYMTCWKDYCKGMVITGMLSMILALLFVWGAITITNIMGFTNTEFDTIEDMVENTFLILGGCLIGMLIAIRYGNFEIKLKKRIENLKYYAGRIEKEDEECR